MSDREINFSRRVPLPSPSPQGSNPSVSSRVHYRTHVLHHLTKGQMSRSRQEQIWSKLTCWEMRLSGKGVIHLIIICWCAYARLRSADHGDLIEHKTSFKRCRPRSFCISECFGRLLTEDTNNTHESWRLICSVARILAGGTSLNVCLRIVDKGTDWVIGWLKA